MSLKELTALVLPPPYPLETSGQDDLARIEERLGVTLPADYVRLAQAYGTGGFVDPGRIWVEVLNPFSSEYLEMLDALLDVFRSMEQLGPNEAYPIFPEKGGLLAWGRDDNGSTLSWLTEGLPDQWPVVVNAPRSEDFERFDLSATTFLARSFKREIAPYIWNSPVLFAGPEPMRFEPRGSQ